jgi:Domain of unknown function (DUF4439)
MNAVPGRNMDAGSPRATAALKDALAAENAAVFGYGVAGAQMSGRQRAQAGRDWVHHERARDMLTELLVSRGGEPPPAAPGYSLPFPVHGARSAAALAAYVEDRVTSAYLGLVALPDARLRALGASEVTAAALRATSWRGGTLAFPGLQEPAAGAP